MYPYHNPVFLLKLLISYLQDIDRIWNTTPEKIKKIQDKSLKRVVKYAYTIPLYHDKYKEAGVHPSDIKGIDDIKKLPLITKDDLRNNYPNGIIPKNFDKENSFLLSTSGSSGKPVFLYYDYFSAIRFTEGYMRSLKALGAVWNKSKICLIVDMKPGSIESTSYSESLLPFLKKFISLDNLKYIHIGEKIDKILQELREFSPEYLATDPNMLRALAHHKNNGKLKNVNPKYLYSGGAMLDDYTRRYTEKAFGTKILDNYGSTEGGPMAFECINGKGYHINSDFVFLEFLDEDGNDVEYGKPGKLVVTRLYGKATPVIRYTGLDDVITPIKPDNSCGITTTQMIKKIGGRAIEHIRLPDGTTFEPFQVTGIPAKVMDDLDTYKIKQFQIIQNKLDEIEIHIIIDEKLRNVGASVEKILKEMEKRFKKAIGSNVKIIVKEVNEIAKGVRSDHVKVVVSKLKNK